MIMRSWHENWNEKSWILLWTHENATSPKKLRRDILSLILQAIRFILVKDTVQTGLTPCSTSAKSICQFSMKETQTAKKKQSQEKEKLRRSNGFFSSSLSYLCQNEVQVDLGNCWITRMLACVNSVRFIVNVLRKAGFLKGFQQNWQRHDLSWKWTWHYTCRYLLSSDWS